MVITDNEQHYRLMIMMKYDNHDDDGHSMIIRQMKWPPSDYPTVRGSSLTGENDGVQYCCARMDSFHDGMTIVGVLINRLVYDVG